MDALCDDLTAEHADLDRMVDVDDLDVADARRGWTVGDQLSHLWFFDQRALLALTDPDAFARDAEAILAAVSGGADDPSVGQGRALSRPTSCSPDGGTIAGASSTTPVRSIRGSASRGTGRR